VADPDKTLADNAQKNYEEVCNSYNAISDFRGKLLGFLPFASGAGLLLLALKPDFYKQPWWIFFAIGLFGFAVTFGLFSYELRGMQRCLFLIELGKDIEEKLRIDGQFKFRPPKSSSFIGASFAGCLIYPIVLAAWTFVALVKICISLAKNIGDSTAANSVGIGFAGAIALGVFSIGFAKSWRWVERQRCKAKREAKKIVTNSVCHND
jgi:hypothetical protein